MTPNLFQYSDYRAYLRDYYEAAKKARPSFSFRYFSQRAGLASPSHLRLVMNGERGLTQKTVEKFAAGLRLNKRETEYFETLVQFNQAQDELERERYLRNLKKITEKVSLKSVPKQSEASLYENWFVPALFELAQTKDFSEDPEWISKRLGRVVLAKDAAQALSRLIENGFLKRDVKSKKLQPATPALQSTDESEELRIRSFQRRMIQNALEHLDDPLGEREISSLTIALTPEQFRSLKERIKVWIRESNQEFSSEDASKKTEVFQLNFQLFRLSR